MSEIRVRDRLIVMMYLASFLTANLTRGGKRGQVRRVQETQTQPAGTHSQIRDSSQGQYTLEANIAQWCCISSTRDRVPDNSQAMGRVGSDAREVGEKIEASAKGGYIKGKARTTAQGLFQTVSDMKFRTMKFRQIER